VTATPSGTPSGTPTAAPSGTDPERWFVAVEHGALHATAGRHHAESFGEVADVQLRLDRVALARLASGEATLADLEADESAGDVQVSGDRTRLDDLLAHLDTFTLGFAIVEP